MSQRLVKKLMASFEELERSIDLTSGSLRRKTGVPVHIMQHVEQYKNIVGKQRALAQKLEVFIEKQDWKEVARHVKLINGLSSMIRDDAQALLNGEEPGSVESVRRQALQ